MKWKNFGRSLINFSEGTEMLSLSELRSICILSKDGKAAFRSLLNTAAVYDKEELAEIFYESGFRLSQFKKLLEEEENVYPGEERLILEAIKENRNPSDLDLLLRLCERKVPLSEKLEAAGLSLDALKMNLLKRIKVKEKSVPEEIAGISENPLIQIQKFRLN
jgi:hypothetical protein